MNPWNVRNNFFNSSLWCYAGCDLYSTVGRTIYVIEDVTMIEKYSFYCDTDAVVVKGDNGHQNRQFGCVYARRWLQDVV